MNSDIYTVKYLLAMFAADIDIFLLKEECQQKDKVKDCFTKAEIRNQLKKSLQKHADVFKNVGIGINAPVPIIF